jgi:RES domain-containing protein
MLLWRVSNYADLSGEGGLHAGGRWHTRGQRVVYLAEHPALALLEVLVHLDDLEEAPTTYQLLTIDVPEGLRIDNLTEVVLNEDAPSWKGSVSECRRMSSPWFTNRTAALLCVPSVVVPGGNYLLNPGHPQASQIALRGAERFDFDQRLISARTPAREAD